MKHKISDRAVLVPLALISVLAITFCGLVMENGWFGYGTITPQDVAVTSYITSVPSDVVFENKVNINTASAKQLEELPSIGETIAARIVAYREEQGAFATVDDLRSVKGIGEKTMEKLRPYVTVESNQ